MELCIHDSLFSLDYKLYEDIATDCWVKYLWKFMSAYGIEVDEDTFGGGILREQDSLLGERFT